MPPLPPTGGWLADLTAHRRILVCVGPGGVGKTTVAAALGLRAALAGRRALVLTIDPARRLATAMGIDPSRAGPVAVPTALYAAAGLAPEGSLAAEMLDTRRALDALVARYAPDEAARARIDRNPFVRRVGDAVSGAHTYMAMERLHEAARSPEYDLLVLDTPPSASALDFLQAPQRMVAMLDNPVLRGLPGAGGAAGRGASRLVRRLAWFTGAEIFDGLGRLFGDLSGMFTGFAERATEVAASLRTEDCAFLVVTAPNALAVQEAAFFRERLGDAGFRFAGFVLNGVQPTFGPPAPTDRADLAARLALLPALAATPVEERLALGEALVAARDHAWRDAERERALLGPLGDAPRVEVPRLSQDVHDLAGLAEVGRRLLG